MGFEFNVEFENMMETNGLKNVIILGHKNPDGDAAGSVLGIAHYIHVVYPQYRVYPYLSEALDKGPKILTLTDTLYDVFNLPELADKYAIIQCDTATVKRIYGHELYKKASCIMSLDHHASNEYYGKINYVKISPACAQNVYEILDWNKWDEAVHPNAADYVYMGIIHDTSGLVRADLGTMTAIEHLMRLGVDHSYIMNTMKDATFEDLKRRAGFYKFVKRVWDGMIAYIIVDQEMIRQYNFTIEDIHPFSSILRDCEDIRMAATLYEEKPGKWRCSFRSDGKWIDVNKLLTPLGGGGHAGAAGLRKTIDDPEKLWESIMDRVCALKDKED